MTFLALMLAAVSGAGFHFAFKKALSSGGRASVFLMLQCFFAAIFVTCINVDLTNIEPIDLGTFNLGVVEGTLYVLMMMILGKALQVGPPGLTVATMNSASVIPAIVMALLFGSDFGHGYTIWNGIGSILVIFGLFIAARGSSSFTASKGIWAVCALIAFAGHSLYLSLFQWRALLLTNDELPHFSICLSPECAPWFQTMIFLTAGVIQLIVYLFTDRGRITRKDLFWAVVGGAMNGLCTFGLIWASEIAKEGEKAMIFPISGVVSILLCSFWGKWAYKEDVNWTGSAICLSGIVLGTVDWSSLLNYSPHAR